MAPEERWTALVTAYAPKLYPILDYILDEVPEAARKELEAVLGDLDRVLMPPFAAEIRGAAAALNVSVGDLVAVNLYYEVRGGGFLNVYSGYSAGFSAHTRSQFRMHGRIQGHIWVHVDCGAAHG